jgi:hypothetical protein
LSQLAHTIPRRPNQVVANLLAIADVPSIKGIAAAVDQITFAD